jgi:transcription termination factor Rho
VPELKEIAKNLGLKPPSNMKKDELVQSILKKQADK